ncbi:class I SAM-dependent methyltransferase [Salidesulfovibrio brasiliensis]|uniref:class I SAM-dependent methyltransferase n=1 Tax=Salidesulfovibrio brasiliensis TaxID=221711 RepID=UPI0006D22788|nr:class I SAM-dependent methyltransferase [Salidesulfovibrio brasiliensis]
MIQDENRITRQKLMERADFSGARVLEIGCGNGRVTAMYAHAPKLAVGIEPDAACAAGACRTVPDARFACASGMALPFVDKTFDVVLFTLSLHHHPDPSGALDEAARVTRSGGRILVLEPKPESEVQRFCNIFESEDHRLEAAVNALEQTALSRSGDEDFMTEWVFKGFEDAARYAFEYYNHPEDETKRQAMRTFLGDRAGDAALVMTDTLRLTCFRV